MAEGSGGTKKWIILIVAVVLLLIIGIVVVWFFLMGGEDEEIAEEKLPISDSAEPLPAPIFMPLGEYTANLRNGRRYLSTSIQLMFKEEPPMVYLQNRLAEVQDVVLGELQELSVEDISNSEAREGLKQRLINVISNLFPSKPEDWEDPEPIKKVLFEKFLIQ